jgi:hypothetical protein
VRDLDHRRPERPAACEQGGFALRLDVAGEEDARRPVSARRRRATSRWPRSARRSSPGARRRSHRARVRGTENGPARATRSGIPRSARARSKRRQAPLSPRRPAHQTAAVFPSRTSVPIPPKWSHSGCETTLPSRRSMPRRRSAGRSTRSPGSRPRASPPPSTVNRRSAPSSTRAASPWPTSRKLTRAGSRIRCGDRERARETAPPSARPIRWRKHGAGSAPQVTTVEQISAVRQPTGTTAQGKSESAVATASESRTQSPLSQKAGDETAAVSGARRRPTSRSRALPNPSGNDDRVCNDTDDRHLSEVPCQNWG